MNTRGRFALAAGVVVLSGLVNLVAAPSLPDQVVSNWSAAGEPNGTMAKVVALWLVAALTAGLVVGHDRRVFVLPVRATRTARGVTTGRRGPTS